MKFDYSLNFIDAMDVLFSNKGVVVGENFKEGTYLKVNEFGVVSVYDFDKNGVMHYKYQNPLQLTKGVMSQKFRMVAVLTEEYLCDK